MATTSIPREPAAEAEPQAEPGTAAEPRLTPRSLHRSALASGGFWLSLPSLVFLALPIASAWAAGPSAQAAGVTAGCAIFGALFLYACGVRAYGIGVRIAWFAAILAAAGFLAIFMGAHIVYFAPMLIFALAVLFRFRWAAVGVGIVIALVVLASAALGELFPALLAVSTAAVALPVSMGIERRGLQGRLAAAEQRNAMLAVAAERARIGRDLHDILGHALTTITVQAQLADRLLERDPASARAALREIEAASRRSLADMRATVSGLQEVRAASEIASARSVLAAAGVEVDSPSAQPELDDAGSELLGYAIREAVTNVARHARATRCRIAVDERSATIADDGVGIPEGKGRTGLAGLAERLESAGGSLEVESGPGGTTVIARLAPAASASGGRSARLAATGGVA